MAPKLDYKQLLDGALMNVVRDALRYAQINGLGDGTHFYITFRTRDAGVVIPDFLRMRYPEMMTIVLQHSFSNLNVAENEFGVTLTFDGRPFYIRIPYDSLMEFKDPSTDFMMQFHPKTQRAGNDLELPLVGDKSPTADEKRIVSLEDFKKNKK
ncbi:MAG: ClpXP protease specificity-enhancing factor SspB [Alphaproteobacteria bacterium]|nr:ClpXP protease specificity-enhancing factor SspB [Alphaproteobacteria bacterium]MCL2889892.1 ClpXP protease specificity-enhancing factor SspB [Alphaproteobacteria bacterium]